MIDLLIIADDFTGALDTAVQFARKSICTSVFLYKDFQFSAIDPKTQVVVIDTESRHISGKEAASRVKQIVNVALGAGVKAFYKKTDSVLRGNIGSELVGLMEARGAAELMFIPAFPDAGRTTRGGCQYIDGVPINETTFADDPVNPVVDCRIEQIISKQSNIPVLAVSREERLNIDNELIDGRRIYVFDVEDNDDMKQIAKLLCEMGKTALTAGCAGFAGMLPDMLGLNRGVDQRLKEKLEGEGFEGERLEDDKSEMGEPEEAKYRGKMLTVCGSMSEVSLRQVRYAKEHGFCSLVLNSNQKLTQDYSLTDDGRSFIAQVAAKIDEGSDVIIAAAESAEDRVEHLGNPGLVTCNIAGIVKGVIEKTDLETITVIGGDTAVAIVDDMGLQDIRPRCEISTGVVLSDAVAQGKRISLITKSGGFGQEDSLLKIKEFAKSLKNEIVGGPNG
jgi:uncharacterized protein YgbK (DUF1537 family)